MAEVPMPPTQKTIPPEVLAAAERLKRVDSGKSVKEVYGVPWRSMEYDHPYHADLRRVLGFFIHFITSQQAEAAERAKVIDEEWLRSVGFLEWDSVEHYDGHEHKPYDLFIPMAGELGCETRLAYAVNGFYAVRVAEYASRFVSESVELLGTRNRFPVVTRGELLDLLAGLKVEVKGGE